VLNMSEYIDRKKLMNTVRKNVPYMYAVVGEMAYNMPAKNVVCCGECRYNTKNRGHEIAFCTRDHAISPAVDLKDDMFCCYGERKENSNV